MQQPRGGKEGSRSIFAGCQAAGFTRGLLLLIHWVIRPTTEEGIEDAVVTAGPPARRSRLPFAEVLCLHLVRRTPEAEFGGVRRKGD